MVNATAAIAAAMTHCMANVHRRLVDIMSTNGLQKGFITHGRLSQPVYRAISVLEMPRRLYMMTDRVITATYGKPCAKYSVGIQAHGLRVPDLCLVLSVAISQVCVFYQYIFLISAPGK